MARLRVPVKIHPTNPDDKAVSQEVAWDVDGVAQTPLTVGPEGDPHLVLGTIDVPDDGSVTVTMTVTAVDRAGNKTATPATKSRTFEGVDTTAPGTPPEPEFLDPEPEPEPEVA